MIPRLTIAIPTLNRPNLLSRAIESALAQSFRDIEILVSDNGSMDDTQAVVARYGAPQLRAFRHPVTMPPARHGQFLIEQARGEFFLGLSDDDFLEPEFVERVVALFDRHPELSFVYTGCAVHYDERIVPATVGPQVESGLRFIAAHYAGRREVCWCACVTRVRDLRALGPQPNDRIIGDMYFWTKLAFLGPVGCVPSVLSHYVALRPSGDNESRSTPILTWAREQSTLASEVLARAKEAAHADAAYLRALRRDTRQYIGGSVANQFAWNRLSGATRITALRSVIPSLPYLSSRLGHMARASAACLLPRCFIRAAVLRGASGIARKRTRRSATAAGSEPAERGDAKRAIP